MLSSEPHPELSLYFWGPFLKKKKDVGDIKKNNNNGEDLKGMKKISVCGKTK